MSYSFDFRNKTGLPVSPPDYRLDFDDPVFLEQVDRYYGASCLESGTFGCGGDFVMRLLTAMARTGVLEDTLDHGEWPENCLIYDETEEDYTVTPIGEAFYGQMVGRAFRVPKFKFWTNDPWILTPLECSWIAYALRGYPNDRIALFGQFCAAATTRGGISVS